MELKDVATQAGLNFAWPEGLCHLRDEAVAVAREAATGRAVREDSWVLGFSREFSRRLGHLGWLGMTLPVVEGGHGRSALERFVVTEALIAHGAPVAASWVGDRQIGPTLLAYGTPAQRRRFLPGIVAGAESWCLGMSEPDAGSDLAHLRTRAVRQGGDFVVEGAKLWTSFASEADWCYLVVRTNAEAAPHAGLSELIVDMSSPGIEVRPVRDMTGAAHFHEVTFDQVVVPGDHLVGALDGSWRQLMRQLEHERGGVDRLVGNRALFELARTRVGGGDAVVRQEAAALETRFRLGRLLVLREALGQAPPGFSAATKVFCTELEQRVAAFAARAFGAESLLWGRPSRALCYAPAYTIQGGTSEILRNLLAERVLGLPR